MAWPLRSLVAYSPAAKALRRCQGTTKSGEPCRAWVNPLRTASRDVAHDEAVMV